MSDDAQAIAAEFGADPAAVRAALHRLAVAFAADPDADADEIVARFARESREFEARYSDPVSRYAGFRDGVRGAVVHEAYTLIREAAGDEEPRRVARRLNGKRRTRLRSPPLPVATGQLPDSAEGAQGHERSKAGDGRLHDVR